MVSVRSEHGWQHNVVPNGRIGLYRVTDLTVFSTWAQTRRNLGTLLAIYEKEPNLCCAAEEVAERSRGETPFQTSAVQRKRWEKPATSASFGQRSRSNQ